MSSKVIIVLVIVVDDIGVVVAIFVDIAVVVIEGFLSCVKNRNQRALQNKSAFLFSITLDPLNYQSIKDLIII